MSHLIYLDECESTNTEILRYLDADSPKYSAVYTFNQTRGRGQYGNSWECTAGQNIAFTFAMKQEAFLLPFELFNFRTAVLLSDFIAKLATTEVCIKWPNDLIIKEKKIGGILSEKITVDGNTFLIVGIGLNVLQTNFKNLPKAGSLATQTGVQHDLKKLARDLYHSLEEGFQDDVSLESVIKDVNSKLFRKNRISVFEIHGIRQNGIIQRIDEDGFLWVELENDGLQKFFHKQIELLY